jgi:membrane dipeptidase
MDSIADLQKLPALLKARGYNDYDIEGVMYRNFVEFLGKAWKE